MTQDLIDGLQEFKHHHYGEDGALMSELISDGQHPEYFIISCIDSRCNPGTIFRAKPGLFLAHKAMGAIVRPYKKGTALAAALQFAIHHVGVETVIVLGHTQCSAIQALVEGIADDEVASFVNVAKRALSKAQECCHTQEGVLTCAEQEVILESTENLKNYPSVAMAIKDKKINVKSWMFDMKTGDLLEYENNIGRFEIVTKSLQVKDSCSHAN